MIILHCVTESPDQPKLVARVECSLSCALPALQSKFAWCSSDSNYSKRHYFHYKVAYGYYTRWEEWDHSWKQNGQDWHV